jgi:DNA polymerase-1
MIKLDQLIQTDKKFKTKMLLQIHDELIFECSKTDEDYVQKVIRDAMTSISSSDYHMFSIPLNVSINSGLNWGEAH